MPKFRWFYIFPAIPLYLIALLPPFLLYGVSDVLRFLLFHVFSYRKQVVLDNLRNSFPDKNEKWIHQTAFRFYQNLVDTILETISLFAKSRSFYLRRFQFEQQNEVEQIMQQYPSVILMCGHMANWEVAGQSVHLSGVQMDVLYHPLSSKFFDWFMYHIRSRFGLYPIKMQSVLRELLDRKNQSSVITFIADQTPGPDGCLWMNFLNQDTPVFLGAEKLAKRFNYPVLYGAIYRHKRGYYSVKFEVISLDPQSMSDNVITEKYMHLLETDIIAHPETWLWSHKRWKHKRKAA